MKSLKELSERARLCSNPEWREVLIGAHLLLDSAVDALWRNPSADNLQKVNGAWALADRMFKQCPPEADPLPPVSGAPEVALLAA